MANVHANIITKELGKYLRKHIAACLRLIDDGCTVPFIARYRKEATGGMDEVVVRTIANRHKQLSEIEKRKEYIKEVITEKGKMTPELAERIEESYDTTELEDIFMPYKPRRATRAQAAREAGLEPLAKIIMAQSGADVRKEASKFVKGVVPTLESAITGAQDIIAEWVSENEKARSIVRSKFQRSAQISSKVVKGKEEQAANFANYFDVKEPLRLCNSHRYLAMRRGEEEGFLKVSISIDDDEMIDRLQRMFVRTSAPSATAEIIRDAVKDGYRRLLRGSIETEIASAAKDRSDESAIRMFADNVRQILMAAPLKAQRILAIDPGYRTGCKVVALDEQGTFIASEVMYPNPPVNDFHGSADLLCYMVDTLGIDTIAVGNGTAGRETERFVRDLRLPRKVNIYSVSEQGASIYSASDVAREEFPDFDVTVRGAISIGRRLLDPLAELVKIEPRSMGVGQYQHDVNQTKLKEALDDVVESCVNSVGVNVNTASRQLLSYVSGIGPTLAANIVAYRNENGPFAKRSDLMKVSRMGEKAFQQCAGFLRIPGGENPLDNTGVHPEAYPLVSRMASDINSDVSKLVRNKHLLHSIELDKFVTKETGLPTLTDIILELEKPGRDPRTTEEKPVFDDNVKKIEDLHIGQVLTGKINNITAFGAFVDIGTKENGLLHISQLSEDFVRSPHEVVHLGQTVRVKVLDVDAPRGRIALTMIGVPEK